MVSGKWKKRAVVLKIEPRPFAVGSMRGAYRMQDLTLEEGEDNEFVAKISKNRNEDRNVYFNDVKMQMESKFWAEKFNNRFGKDIVDFLVAYVAELVERPGTPLIGVENRVAGNYVKYNNNWDWNDDRRNTPQAFSHFTWEASEHRILVCDLQGVGDMWTDPQIHSHDGVGYGKGNMGMKGINAFLRNHRCNAICQGLGLPRCGKTPKPLDSGTLLKPIAFRADATLAECLAINFAATLFGPGKKNQKPNPAQADRLSIHVVGATGMPNVDGRAPDLFAVGVLGDYQSFQTKVAYGQNNPVWNQQFKLNLPRDAVVDKLTIVIYECPDQVGVEHPRRGFAEVPFAELKDESGYDERDWKIQGFGGSGQMGNLRLRICRFTMAKGAPIPKPNKPTPAAPAAGAGSGQPPDRHGIKVMVRQAQLSGPNLGVTSQSRLFCVIKVERNEAKTRACNPTEDPVSLRWDQKMAFPTFREHSYCEVVLIFEGVDAKPGTVLAVTHIPIKDMAFDPEHHMPSTWFNISDVQNKSVAVGSIQLEAWLTPGTAPQPSAATPKPQDPPVGTVSC